MSDINNQGLSSHVPLAIQRQIRKESCFGCVVCGQAFGTIEHIEPLFKDAEKHDPKALTFLCGTCQTDSSGGRLSKSTIWQCKANPFACKNPAKNRLDLDSTGFTVNFGGLTSSSIEDIIRVSGTAILKIVAARDGSSPSSFSAMFHDSQGNQMLEIIENVVQYNRENWDVHWIGTELTIREGAGKIALAMRISPPKSVSITRLNMRYNGWHIVVKDSKLTFTDPDGGTNSFEEIVPEGSHVGLSLGYDPNDTGGLIKFISGADAEQMLRDMGLE